MRLRRARAHCAPNPLAWGRIRCEGVLIAKTRASDEGVAAPYRAGAGTRAGHICACVRDSGLCGAGPPKRCAPRAQYFFAGSFRNGRSIKCCRGGGCDRSRNCARWRAVASDLVAECGLCGRGTGSSASAAANGWAGETACWSGGYGRLGGR